MAWANAANIVKDNLDAGTDSPSLARSDLAALMDEVIAIINARGVADGIASLNVDGRIDFGELPSDVRTDFPAAGSFPFGYRIFRTDLGEWFVLMDATAWGGTGRAWISESVTTLTFGRNIAGTFDVSLYGPGAGPAFSSTNGFHLGVDMILTVSTFRNAQAFTGSLEVSNGATVLRTDAVTQTGEAGRAVADWKEVAANAILWCRALRATGTFDDGVAVVQLRRRIAAT